MILLYEIKTKKFNLTKNSLLRQFELKNITKFNVRQTNEKHKLLFEIQNKIIKSTI